MILTVEYEDRLEFLESFFRKIIVSDSWSRYPNGMLVGTSHQMGIYDECIEVHSPVQGKYCIPHVILDSAVGEDFKIGKPGSPQTNDHAWLEILGFIDYDLQVRRNHLKFGICIPDACSASDLEISLQKEFDKQFLPYQVKALVKVDPMLCSTDQDMYPFSVGYYLTNFLVGFMILICCLSTFYHLLILIQSSDGSKTYKIPEILFTFSMIRHTRDLIKYDKSSNLNFINGWKFATMMMVIFGHTILSGSHVPLMYAKVAEKIPTEGPYFLLTTMNLVDPFLYITGYLLYIFLIKQFKNPKTKWVQIPMIIFYKYLRILPSYVMMMLLTVFVIPHMDNGPLWASKIWPEANKCKNYWWANLLLISNFIKVENQCLIESWYISCLVQLLTIGTILMYLYVKHKKIGIYLITICLCASLVIPFILTYVYRIYGILRIINSAMENPSSSPEFSYFYRPFYVRGAPFFIGLLAGVVVEELNIRKITFPVPVVHVGTVIVTAICTWLQLYCASFYEIHRPYNVLEQSLYAMVYHCVWAIALFWVTICHFTTGYGPIDKVFNNRLLTPLGRLTYTVFLVNVTVMTIVRSRQRNTVYPSLAIFIEAWTFSVCRSYFMGFLLHIIIDAPLGLLIKHLIFEKYSKYANKNYPVTTNPTNTEIIEENNSTYL